MKVHPTLNDGLTFAKSEADYSQIIDFSKLQLTSTGFNNTCQNRSLSSVNLQSNQIQDAPVDIDWLLLDETDGEKQQ